MKKIILSLALVCAVSSADARSAFQKMMDVSAEADTIRYQFLEPETVKKGEKYPLVLFLHGSGERGRDNVKQMTWGANMWENPVNREKYPAYVLIPQCPPDKFWSYDYEPAKYLPEDLPVMEHETAQMLHLMSIVKKYISGGNIDPKRVYIMGLSMGAMGTYDLALRYPDVFAAAVPMCGAINPARFKNSDGTQLKWRIIHGDRDSSLPVDGSRCAYKELKKQGASVYYNEIPSCDHGCWIPAFEFPDFMSWLFAQHK